MQRRTSLCLDLKHTGLFSGIKKHGPRYWLDIRVNGRWIRRSLKTGEWAQAIERGVAIVTISAILGHSKMMTSLLYLHTDKKKKKKAIDYLNI